MTETVKACALEIPDPVWRERIANTLRSQQISPILVLNTCQRLETYGWQPAIPLPVGIETHIIEEGEAIRRLARIAAGLESRVIGELEVMGQVRQAYKDFHAAFGKEDSSLDRMFQQALALARKARRESGIDSNLTGLAGLTARKVMDSVPEDTPVAVIGSGSLAKSVARYLGKRSNLPVHVSSRCPENAMKLAMEVGGFASGLDELVPVLSKVDVVVSATAAPHPIIYNRHLSSRPGQKKLVIDLGEPPDCAEEVQVREDIEYVGLLDIEDHAQANTEERRACAAVAEEIIASADF